MSTTQIPADDTTSTPPPRQRRAKHRGRRAAAALGVVVAAGAGLVIAEPFGTHATDTATQATVATALAHVTKGSLSARSMENGTLGYAGDYQAINNLSGKLTGLPTVGQVLHQGEVLYWVDGKPVILLRGTVPSYRDLSWGMSGADVEQLNAALVSLGYANESALDPESDYFGRATYYALRKFQAHYGLAKTGTLPLGQVTYLGTAEARITKVNGVLGTAAAPGQAVLTVSSTARVVTVSLSASQQTDVKEGDKVTISLPSGKTTAGVVSAVGKVATKDESSGNTTIEVLITPGKPADTGQLDQAPVQVMIVSETVNDVLSVPVNALLALASGGYAVEVVDTNGNHRLIRVTTGLFDDSEGKVEVSGTGLGEGQNVVVPSS